MSRILFTLFAVLLASQVGAQIVLDLVTEKDTFIPGEELRVGVRIGNISGQTLHFEESKDWVSFMFDPNDKIRVRQTSDIPVEEPFAVKNSTRATRWFDLAPHFDIATPGYYTVSAVVKIKDWGEERVTAPVRIGISSPSTIWEQNFGVPPKAGTGAGAPEVRKYMIQRVTSLAGSELYVRVAGVSEQNNVGIADIGPFLQMNDAIQQRIDEGGKLHVLHRSGRKSFTYSMIEPDGRLSIRQRHDYNEFTQSRPSLGTASDGKVVVFGGTRKFSPNDMPPSEGDLSK